MLRWLNRPWFAAPVERDVREPGLEAFHTAAAQDWLERLAAGLGPGYRIDEGQSFLLLSPESLGDARPLLKIAQDNLRRVRHLLQRLAHLPGPGKLPVVVLADADAYYEYVARFYPDGGEYGLSGGMFIDAGRPHIVTAANRFDVYERVMAHELTHLCLRHLHLPVWLDEGIAVNTEERLLGGAPSLYRPRQLQYMHAHYWNAGRIQALWQGRIFHAPDDGQLLGYDLAKHLVALMARPDFEAFIRFAEHARRDDAGAAACLAHLGLPLHRYAAAIVGEGDWQPSGWGDLENGLLASPDAP